MRRLKSALMLVIATLVMTSHAQAQSTHGTISGKVLDGQGLAVPGVVVTAQSPSIQGDRTAVTSEHGDYVIPLLPSGAYSLTFEISGFETTRRTVTLAPTQSMSLDVELGLNTIQETVEVTGRTAEILTQTSQAAANFNQGLIASLPTNRDVTSSLLLAPSVHASGPGGNFSISGAPSYESAYLVNGVTATENIRGQIQPNLMIEDAIQETTVASAGISAEFGRFTGGVVNVVTKSGGNGFSGSFRDTLNNDDWRALVPSQPGDLFTTDSKLDVVVPTYEYTVGGPILKNRLWFFTAGRAQTQKTERQLVVTNYPYTFTNKLRRYEGKGTFAINSEHRVQVAYNKVANEQMNYVSQTGLAMDPNMLQDRELPEQLLTFDYTGVIAKRWFVEARFSGRDLSLVGSGAKSQDRIFGTQVSDTAGRMFWTDLFCGVCDDETRDNRDFFAKTSYFLSTSRFGAHQMVAGVDAFNDKRFANNHQFGSDYQIMLAGSIVRGTAIYPQFTSSSLIRWRPILLETEGTNFRTNSLFFNDAWAVNGRFTANLGLRWDKNDGRNGADELVSTAGALSPRFGVNWDPTGSQHWSVTASLSKYTAGLLNSIADSTSAGGNPERYDYAYGGPAINADPNGVLLTTDQALSQLFAWFDANGGTGRPIVGTPLVRGVSARTGDLKSPNTWEYAAGVNRQFGSRAAVRADFIYRDANDFYASQTDMTTGRVTDTRTYVPPTIAGRTYDLAIISNSDIYKRQYAGLTSQATYRIGSMLETGASYTLSRLWGNVDGENFGSGPLISDLQSYPEYKRAEWYQPEGDLSADQRHRARLWMSYQVPGMLHGLSLGAIQTLESGVPYGATTASGVDARPYVTNPGYLTPPAGTQTTYYYTARDAFRTEGQKRTDFAATYTRTIPGTRRLEGFGQLQVINVFNQFQLCACGNNVFSNGGGINVSQTIDATVRTPANSQGYPTFNPFTTTPVKGVNWDLGPNFGHAANRLAYTMPRMLRLSFGVRF